MNWDRINTARATLLRTMDFLDWLGHRGQKDPEQCTQADLDAWFAANQGRLWAVDRMCLFLRWAMEHQVMNRLRFTRPEGGRRAPLSQHQRVALLRQVLASEDLPLLERVAALQVLLYAQPISRVVRLTLGDVIQDETGAVSIRLGKPPSPVPNPFAGLLLLHAAAPEHDYGHQPEQPVADPRAAGRRALPTTRSAASRLASISTGAGCRVAPAHCCAGAPSEPCVPLVVAHGSSKP